jgi:hypothetical protein
MRFIEGNYYFYILLFLLNTKVPGEQASRSIFGLCAYSIIIQKRENFMRVLIISIYITITLVSLFTFAGPYFGTLVKALNEKLNGFGVSRSTQLAAF